MESKRQKQVARLIQENLSDIFLREAREITGQAMVTVSVVRMTPDLLTARVYLSVYNTDDAEGLMRNVEANNKALRRLLGNRIRHSVRKIPELSFFRDDTLDEVFRLEQIFRELKEKEDRDDSPEKQD